MDKFHYKMQSVLFTPTHGGGADFARVMNAVRVKGEVDQSVPLTLRAKRLGLRWTKKLVQKLVAARVPLENCLYNPLPVLLFYVPVAVNPPPHECRSGADAAQHARRLVAHASLVASVVAVVVLVRV